MMRHLNKIIGLKLNKFKVFTVLMGEVCLVMFFPSKLKNKDIYIMSEKEHHVLTTTTSFTPDFFKSFQKDLVAPEGYEIIDYSFYRSLFHSVENILYQNSVDVILNKLDWLPDVSLEKFQSRVYQPYEDVIVKCNVSFSVSSPKDQIKFLTAPEGYQVFKYNYDHDGEFIYEVLLYKNVEPVYKREKDSFGEALTVPSKDNDILDIGEQRVAIINVSKDWFFKEKDKELECPVNYRIIDYDYNKNANIRIETVVYENTVPIVKDIFWQEVVDEDLTYFVTYSKKIKTGMKDILYVEDIDDFSISGYNANYGKYYECDSKLFVKKK